jgi:hypothetical protein
MCEIFRDISAFVIFEILPFQDTSTHQVWYCIYGLSTGREPEPTKVEMRCREDNGESRFYR